jgi:hypothetical protein
MYKSGAGSLPRRRLKAYLSDGSIEFPTPGLDGCHFHNGRELCLFALQILEADRAKRELSHGKRDEGEIVHRHCH